MAWLDTTVLLRTFVYWETRITDTLEIIEAF